MKRVFLISAMFILIAFTSCRDKTEYIVGEWREIPFTDPQKASKESTWKFYAGDALEIETLAKSETEKDTVIKYTYTLTRKKLTIYGNWPYSSAVRDPRGEYWVDVLKKKTLKITKRKHPADLGKGGAYIRKEFVKK